MNLFEDLEAAREEAQYLADHVLHCRQRRAAFLIRKGDGILVTQHNPKQRTVIETFAPTPKARRIYRNNKSGYPGIYVNDNGTRWRAQIKRKGKKIITVGSFKCLATAIAERSKALKELGYV